MVRKVGAGLGRGTGRGAGRGKPKTNTERLKTHFGKNWKKHKVSELPKRGNGKK